MPFNAVTPELHRHSQHPQRTFGCFSFVRPSTATKEKPPARLSTRYGGSGFRHTKIASSGLNTALTSNTQYRILMIRQVKKHRVLGFLNLLLWKSCSNLAAIILPGQRYMSSSGLYPGIGLKPSLSARIDAASTKACLHLTLRTSLPLGICLTVLLMLFGDGAFFFCNCL